jgi:phospholipase C
VLSGRQRRGLAAGSAIAVAACAATAAFAAGPASSAHVRGSKGHERGVHGRRDRPDHGQPGGPTTTPIKHLVVIFQENVSFDHYFGTYPHAANPSGEPGFHAAADTPSVNGLSTALLTQNPNLANPTRLDRSEALTCDQDHDYTPEQEAFDHGLMDKFVQFTNTSSCSPPDTSKPNLVMDYYDGNTVTGLWNYAQHFAMSDNSYDTTFGPSTPGALNLVSGQTHGATPAEMPDVVSEDTVIGDADPTYDDCSSGSTIAMSGKNIGDLLNDRGVTWGWFEGGFRPTSTNAGKAVCGSTHQNIGGATQTDYSPHHEPFQYYQSTSNPHHLPPSSVDMIGKTDQANHQYDLSDFWASVGAGNMPAVSFLKAARYQDGHAGYSDPLDEQHFLVDTINRLERSRDWKSTAVLIAYDDSDGWYDHQMSPIVNQSDDASTDALTDPGHCGTASTGAYEDRCGYGPRLPLLAISPFSRVNSVDHGITDQSSVLKFIEDNWQTGQIGDQSFDAKAGTLDNLFDFGRPRARPLFLDPVTGEPSDRGHVSQQRGHRGGHRSRH